MKHQIKFFVALFVSAKEKEIEKISGGNRCFRNGTLLCTWL